jgi:hypothetical protein
MFYYIIDNTLFFIDHKIVQVGSGFTSGQIRNWFASWIRIHKSGLRILGSGSVRNIYRSTALVISTSALQVILIQCIACCSVFILLYRQTQLQNTFVGWRTLLYPTDHLADNYRPNSGRCNEKGGRYNYYLSIYCREWNLYPPIYMECLTFMGHKITSLGDGGEGENRERVGIYC